MFDAITISVMHAFPSEFYKFQQVDNPYFHTQKAIKFEGNRDNYLECALTMNVIGQFQGVIIFERI